MFHTEAFSKSYSRQDETRNAKFSSRLVLISKHGKPRKLKLRIVTVLRKSCTKKIVRWVLRNRKVLSSEGYDAPGRIAMRRIFQSSGEHFSTAKNSANYFFRKTIKVHFRKFQLS